MTRPKKGGGGRHTPKQPKPSAFRPNSPASPMPSAFDDPARLPNFPHIDPHAFEKAILENSIDLNEIDPEDLDLEALGLGDIDPIEIIIARLEQSLDESAGRFLEEASGAAWMVHDSVAEGERADPVNFYAGFDHVGACLVNALAVLGMDDEVREAAAVAGALRRGELPVWLQQLNSASVTGCALETFDPDDDVHLLAEITIPNAEPFVLLIARIKTVHELIGDIFVMDRTLANYSEEQREHADGGTVLEVSPQRLADELALNLVPSISWADNDDAPGLPFDNAVEVNLPLAAWLARLLPHSDREPFFGFEGEERDRGLERYEDVRGEPLETNTRKRLGQVLDFSVESDPFRWSPQRLISMFERLAPYVDDPEAVVADVRPFLEFAAKEHGTSDELLGHNMTVLDRVLENKDELFG